MQIDNNDVLIGSSILLVPMEESHREGLRKALNHPDIWEYTWRKISSFEDIDELAQLEDELECIPFHRTAVVIGRAGRYKSKAR